MLLHLGCDIAQGYGIAHPMAAEVLAKWITHWETVRTWKDVPPAQATPRGAMYAYVEHRAWFAAFDGYIQGRRTSPPSLRRDECRLGTWLRQERQSDAMPTAAMQVLERTHGQVHESAEEIYRLLAEERRSDALVMVNHLRETHNRCLNRLQAFLRMGTGRQRSSTNPRRRVSRTGHILAN